MGNHGGKPPLTPESSVSPELHRDLYLEELERQQHAAKQRRASLIPDDGALPDDSFDVNQNLTFSTDPKDWIQLTATAEECTSFLENHSEGAFVVYREASPDRELRLAVKVQSDVRHEIIVTVPKEGYSLVLTGAPLQPVFQKLDDLLMYYQEPRPEIPVVLMKENPLFGSDLLLEKFKGARMASTYSADKPGVQRRPSVRTAEELSSFQAVVISDRANEDLVRARIEAAQPKPQPEKIPEFARRVAESDAASQLRKSTENLAEASNPLNSSPEKKIVKTEPISYEEWVPGAMPPPPGAYGFQPKANPQPATEEAESFGFDAEEIEAAAADSGVKRTPLVPVAESTYGTASDLQAPKSALVISEDLNFYGSPTGPAKTKAPPSTLLLLQSEQEMYGSPQQLTKAKEKPALIPVEEQLYGSPQKKSDSRPASVLVQAPQESVVIVESSDAQSAPDVVISSSSSVPIVVSPANFSLEAPTSTTVTEAKPSEPTPEAAPVPTPQVPEGAKAESSSMMVSVRKAPEPPSRPSLEASKATPPASKSQNAADKDGLYEFPVVIGHREGKNPNDVFDWARGTDVFLPVDRPSPPWIHGTKVTRIEAERIFARMGNIDGMFLVRQRVTDTVLSYALSIVVEQHIEHHIVDVQPSRYSLLGTHNIATVSDARSLEDLVRQLGAAQRAAHPQLAVCIPYVKEDQYNRPEWLHGTISRDEACYRLFQDEKYVDGRFLVRVSTKQYQSQAVYVVSLVYNQQFHHHLVSADKNQWFLNNVLCKDARSLSDVIQWMMSVESNLECVLQTYIPCPPPYYLLKISDPISRAPIASGYQPQPPRLRAASASVPIAIPRSGTIGDQSKAQAAAAAVRQTVPPSFHREDHFSSSPATSSPHLGRQGSGDERSVMSVPPMRSPSTQTAPQATQHPAHQPVSSPLTDPAESPMKKEYDNVYADANTIFYEVEQLLRPEEETFLKPVEDAPPTFIRPRIAPAPPRAASPASPLQPAAHPAGQIAEDE